MSYCPNPFGPPPRFILESVELLLARLGQLGHHVRDTVARIVGSSVAEAVSEALRLIVHRLPGRRSRFVRANPWSMEVDPYDPYGDDDLVAEQYSGPSRYDDTPMGEWRRMLTATTTFSLDLMHFVWRWAVLRRGRIAAAVVVGTIALVLSRSHRAAAAA